MYDSTFEILYGTKQTISICNESLFNRYLPGFILNRIKEWKCSCGLYIVKKTQVGIDQNRLDQLKVKKENVIVLLIH